jgi:hypothetical protein
MLVQDGSNNKLSPWRISGSPKQGRIYEIRGFQVHVLSKLVLSLYSVVVNGEPMKTFYTISKAILLTRIIRYSLGLVSAVLLPPMLCVAQSRLPLELGMSQEEVRKAFGEPSRYFSTATQRFLGSEVEAQAARQVSGPFDVEDVYEFTTALNTYEFRIWYLDDSRQSRFRPTMRVRSITFELDRPIQDVKQLLPDMPEARLLCSQGCSILERSDHRNEELFAYATSPSPTEIQDAGLVSVRWRDDDPNDKTPYKIRNDGSWIKAIVLKLEGGKIVSGQIDAIHRDRRSIAVPLATIGSWKP